jgi:molecular chaperone GrpE
MSENKKIDAAEDQETETQAEDSEETTSTPLDAELETPEEEDASEDSESEDLPSAEEFARLKARQDQMLRTIAEFDNSKKRVEREKEEFLKYALESFVKDLIPTVDSIERAINSTKESKDFDALVEGIQMIHKQLLGALENRGVTPIEAVSELFDPMQHEAVMHVESEDVPENQVIEEWQRGYMLHNRVIRPSMVSVSKGKGEKEEESNE